MYSQNLLKWAAHLADIAVPTRFLIEATSLSRDLLSMSHLFFGLAIFLCLLLQSLFYLTKTRQYARHFVLVVRHHHIHVSHIHHLSQARHRFQGCCWSPRRQTQARHWIQAHRLSHHGFKFIASLVTRYKLNAILQLDV
ncbi:hypothetical protein F2Q69_00035728 [Brassica cretica]|uniref:Uncharacterized protein n=1 Tax=Brassica cretica TaxID=69181 RepID=A0A8S9SD48_BRACR|nr:hypothetical protein F2Q69_00035728 [Brassica cretica]